MFRGNIAIVKELLDKGADASVGLLPEEGDDASEDKKGWTPLDCALEKGHVRTITE